MKKYYFYIFILVALLFIVFSCKSKEQPVIEIEPEPEIVQEPVITPDTITPRREKVSLILNALTQVYDDNNSNIMDTYLAHDYIEYVSSKTLDFNRLSTYFNRMKHIDITRKIFNIAIDNDMVALHSLVTYSGSPYSEADIFKIANGKIVARWTISESILSLEESAHANKQVGSKFYDIPTAEDIVIQNTTNTARIKETAIQIITDVFYSGNSNKFASLLADDFIQHSAQIPDGKEAFVQFVKLGPNPQTINAVVASNNTVFINATHEKTKHSIMHIFGFNENLQVNEYWSIERLM